MYERTPEPPVNPPEPYYIMAGCGHEVYEGEGLFDWDNGSKITTLCAECLREKLCEMDLYEMADIIGAEWRRVRRPQNVHIY